MFIVNFHTAPFCWYFSGPAFPGTHSISYSTVHSDHTEKKNKTKTKTKAKTKQNKNKFDKLQKRQPFGHQHHPSLQKYPVKLKNKIQP